MGSRLRGPGFKFQQGIHLVEFLELVGPGAEAGPYGNHEVGVVLVYVFHHLFWAFEAGFRIAGILVFAVRQVAQGFRIVHLVDVARVHEFHGVPVGIASPVLPVLYDTVEGNF